MPKNSKPPAFDDLASVNSAEHTYSSELTEVTGVVSLTGQGGCPKCDEYEVHCFEFAVWRRTEGSLIEKPLTILRPIVGAGIEFDDFEDATVHRLQLLISADHARCVCKENGSAEDADLEIRTKTEGAGCGPDASLWTVNT